MSKDREFTDEQRNVRLHSKAYSSEHSLFTYVIRAFSHVVHHIIYFPISPQKYNVMATH